MSVICPCVTAKNSHTYRTQFEKAEALTNRIHIDIGDGEFSPKLIDINKLWWPKEVIADIHVMYKNPTDVIDELINLRPNLIILHAEADGKYYELAQKLHDYNIRSGIAMLEQTKVDVIEPSINNIDYVLIFSGHLGHYGGIANTELLDKVDQIKKLKESIEIGWDGGINDTNIVQLVNSGINTLNVGGYIQRAEDPRKAYAKLESLIKELP